MVWFTIGLLAFFCCTLFTFIIYQLEHKGFIVTQNKRYLIGWIVVLVVFVPAIIFSQSRGLKNGKEYYINMFESLDAAKNYRVPGLIKIDEGYHLDKVLWSNGGYITFENSGVYEELEIGEKVKVIDDKGKTWFVELTRKRVK